MGAKKIKLRRLVTLKGYNGRAPKGITHATVYYLTVNGQR